MATPLEIVNKALRMIGDDEISSDSITTNSYAKQVLEGLNFILRDLYSKNPKWAILQASATFATVADTQSYSLPSGIDSISDIKSIVHPDNFELKKLTQDEYQQHLLPRDFEETTLTSGTPIYWFGEATTAGTEKIYLYPVPDTAETITVYYQTPFSTAITSSNVTSTTIVPFKEGYLNMVVAGVMWMAAERLGSQDAERFRQLYERSFILSTLEQDNAKETLEVDPYFAKGFI